MSTAIVSAAPRLAVMKDRIQSGDLHAMDISSDIAQAAKKLSQLREAGQSFKDYLEQGALFDDGITPLAKNIIEIFEYYKRSPKSIKGIFDNYIEAVNRLGNPKQGEMCGEMQIPAKAEILQAAIRKMEVAQNAQTTLFKNQDAYGYEGLPPAERGGQGEGEKSAKPETEKADGKVDISLGKGEGVQLEQGRMADIVSEIERIAAPDSRIEFKDKIEIPKGQLADALQRWGKGD
ncbi:MAG: hypothetical protein HZC45_03295, partial [Deltaproteobacteria bacterium]|nr:hypothetical protein [Deltaproteobacteria bacterium]